jgi:hypothetical protein
VRRRHERGRGDLSADCRALTRCIVRLLSQAARFPHGTTPTERLEPDHPGNHQRKGLHFLTTSRFMFPDICQGL